MIRIIKQFNRTKDKDSSYSDEVFKLACMGRHIKTIEFLMYHDQSNIILDEEDVSLLIKLDLKIWITAIGAEIKIRRHKVSDIRNVFNLLK